MLTIVMKDDMVDDVVQTIIETNQTGKPGDGKCALVTDILTDANAGSILCEALGRPYVMIAMVGGFLADSDNALR